MQSGPRLAAGTILGGRYRVVRAIGLGGMGTVYEGLQIDLGRRVAIKVLNIGGDPTFLERFRREAQSAASLGHPNIVTVTDFQTPPGEPAFLVMELLEGESLASAIARGGPLAPSRAAFIAGQVLAVLEVAHRAGVIHRDIKPDNVFLVQTPASADVVKVLDFGIAKLESPEAAPLTVAGAAIGTPQYASPEQAMAKRVDHRTDLYAVGATLYHALTGRAPGESTSAATAGAPASLVMVPPLEAVRPDLPAALARIVDRAMAFDPDQRFQSASEMRAALAPFVPPASSPVLASAPPPAASAPRVVPSQMPTVAAPVANAPRPGYAHPRPVAKGSAWWIGLVVFGLAMVAMIGSALFVGTWWIGRAQKAAREQAASAEAEPTTAPPPVWLDAGAPIASTQPISTSTASYRGPSIDAGARASDAGARSVDAGWIVVVLDAGGPRPDAGTRWTLGAIARIPSGDLVTLQLVQQCVSRWVDGMRPPVEACFRAQHRSPDPARRTYYYAMSPNGDFTFRLSRRADNVALDGCVQAVLTPPKCGAPPPRVTWPSDVDVELVWAPSSR